MFGRIKVKICVNRHTYSLGPDQYSWKIIFPNYPRNFKAGTSDTEELAWETARKTARSQVAEIKEARKWPKKQTLRL